MQVYNNLAESHQRVSKFIIKVKSEAELIEKFKVYLAQEPHAVFRPFGGRHSWAPTVLTEDEKDVFLIDTSELGYKRDTFVPLQIDNNCFLVPAPPSFTQSDLANYVSSLHPPLCVYPTGAVKSSIHLGGFLNSGCHGSGINLPPVSELVMATRIITIKNNEPIPILFIDPIIQHKLTSEQLDQICGNAIVINNLTVFFAQDPELKRVCDEHFPGITIMDFVRVNFGTLGVVTEFWIKCQHRFTVHAVDEVVPMNDVLNEDFAQFLNSHDHLELFYAPFDKLSKRYSFKNFPYIQVPVPGKMHIKYANISTDKGKLINEEKQLLFHDRLVQELSDSDRNLEEVIVNLSETFINTVINNTNIKITPTFLQALGKAAYGHELSNNGVIVGCGKVLIEEFPKYERTKYFNDFSLFESSVISNLIDIEMEIPLDFKQDPYAKNFRNTWKSTLKLIQEYALRGEYPCNITVHCRFNGSSKSLLSGLYSKTPNRQFATLECVCAYHPSAPQKYLDSVGNFMIDVLTLWQQTNASLIGDAIDILPRPHFAKSWFDLPDGCTNQSRSDDIKYIVMKLYANNIRAYQMFRKQIDPQNHFLGGLVKYFELQI